MGPLKIRLKEITCLMQNQYYIKNLTMIEKEEDKRVEICSGSLYYILKCVWEEKVGIYFWLK